MDQQKTPQGAGDQLTVNGKLGHFGGLAMSKSENNLYEKSSKFLLGDGSANRLFAGYEGVVTSMRDLQFEAEIDAKTATMAMNDLSKTQVLNMIAASREEVVAKNPVECPSPEQPLNGISECEYRSLCFTQGFSCISTSSSGSSASP